MPPVHTTRADLRQLYSNLNPEELDAERLAVLDRLDAGEQGADAEADALQAELAARALADERRQAVANGTVMRRTGLALPETRTELTSMLSEYARAGAAGSLGRDLDARQMRVLLLGTNVPTTTLPGIVGPPVLPVTDLVSVLPQQTVGSGSVEYLVDTTDYASNPAAVVAEGAAKPEATLTFDQETLALDVVAVWTAASRQWLEDVSGGDQYLQTRLQAMVRARLDTIAYTALSTATGTGTASGASLTEVVATSAAQLAAAGFTASVAVVNGTDPLTSALATGQDGHWLGQPTGLTLPPIVIDPNAAPCTVLTLDRVAAALLIRGAARVLVADQHADLFIKNVLIVLAETRAGLAVYQPSGVVVGTITPPAP